MGIVNKRNAVLGWAVWQVAKYKAKAALRSEERDTGRPNTPVILATLAAVGAGLIFWRKKSSEGPAPPIE